MDKKNSKFKDKTLFLIYRLTNYLTYSSFRKSLFFSRFLVWVAIFLTIIDIFIPNITYQNMLISVILILLTFYMIYSYWIFAKASQLKKDSAYVMSKIALSGVKASGWHIYNGIYNNGNQNSIEITFVEEKSLLTDIYRLLTKKHVTLPLSTNEVINIKDYIQIITANSTDDNKFVAYATLSDDMARLFLKNGIKLKEMSNRFRNKPLRFDYAAANGNIKKAISEYPKNFKAYVLET